MEKKKCTKCNKFMGLDKFYSRKERNNRPRSKCKKCEVKHARKWLRAWQLKSRYGITQARYSALVRKQHNKCAICKSKKPKCNKRTRRWHIDHNHKTKIVRGLLCFRCNSALGIYEKHKKQFEKYLQKTEGKQC